MTIVKLLPALAAAATLALGTPVLGQTTQDPHHPNQTESLQKKSPVTKRPPPAAASGSSGMMMQGGMPMMGMMMDMMGSAMMSNAAMPGMDMADHVEGRIAFLRTEIKITDAQAKAWNEFAETLRSNAKMLSEARTTAMQQAADQPASLVQRLGQQEIWYTARLNGIRAMKAAVPQLYAALSDEQKAAADQLLAPHLGLMPMGGQSMAGMGAGGMMMGAMGGGMKMGGAQ